MFSDRTAWLVGASGALDGIAVAFKAQGCRTERIGPDQVAPWLARVRSGDFGGALPNLVILDADTAWLDDAAVLDVLATVRPWAGLPRVVVAQADEPARCRHAYARGAASFVVLADGEAAHADAETFAIYWLRTALLPEATMPI